MIINRVWAEHVLKYVELELRNLPGEGLIAISGTNESGKSTIGEIICFALFGRTFSLAPDEIVKVIRWGEPRCAAIVAFTVDGQPYELSRFLDDSGTQGARLAKQDTDETVARGVDAVHDALIDLLGFGFEEFIESFYLAQREITTPQPHSTAVKRMAGIAALESVTAVAESEIEHARTSIATSNNQILECENRLAELAFDEERLSELEAVHQEQVRQQEQDAAKLSALKATIATYDDAAAKVTASVQPIAEVELATSFQEWQTRVGRVDEALETIEGLPHNNPEELAPHDLRASVHDAKAYLEGFVQLKEHVAPYREHLAHQLGEYTEQEDNPSMGQTLSEQQAMCDRAHDRASHRYGKMRIGCILLGIVAVLGWLALGLVGFQSDMRSVTWVLGAVAVVCTVGAGFCGVRCRNLRLRMTQLEQSSRDLEDQMHVAQREAHMIDTVDSTSLSRAVDALDRLGDRGIKDAVLQLKTGVGETFLNAERLSTFKTILHGRVADQCTRLQEAGTRAMDTAVTIETALSSRENELETLTASLEIERERRRTHDEVRAQIVAQQAQIAGYNRRIAARLLACDVIAGGCHHIAKIFNRDIRGLVSRTLPLLTAGRYEHLKLDENLDVQVFSSEKQDFMFFEEVSSGTQRQIMLALRLALSQEFINTTLGRQQFLFLDEPFAFFDQERTRAALRVLPDLSHEICQIWLVAQEFPDGAHFEAHIHCAKEQDRLSVAGV